MNKLLSRKLAVTVATILTVVLQIQDPVRAGIVGVVAIAYVIAQSFVDHATIDSVVAAVDEGVNKAREVAS